MRKLVNLRELRERAALSQQELAKRAGISKNAVGQLERGEFNPRPVTVRQLAEALGVRPEELWEGERSKELVAGPKAEAPLLSIPEIRERLRELGGQRGVTTRKEFIEYMRGIDPEIDEDGNPNGIITAQREVAEEADDLLTTALREPEVRKSLEKLLPVEPGLSGLDLVHERAQKFRKLKRELRRLYNARIVALVNYANALAAEEEAAGKSPGYFRPRLEALERAKERAFAELERELLATEVV